MRIETYQDRKKRDARYKELCAAHGKESVIRRSCRNQLMHPQYVDDYQGAARHDTGIGNTVYKTHFPVLYIVEVRARADHGWMR
jgi:hypothetical protein